MNKNIKTALIIGGIILAVLIVLLLVFGLIPGRQGYGYGMIGSGMMGGVGAMFITPILWIGILILIIWAITAAARGPWESNIPAQSADSALQVLKRRYARGEIDREEYETRKKDIT
ncbi:MAG: SHOCT domain-containing protein [Chloroflexi bacterium]|nr:SHOCT domain-containing protein [Chloroflexota bacterium]